jgi:hypothetical protein
VSPETRSRWLAAAGLALALAIAAGLRLPELSRQPIEHDEVYSYLAALGFLETGQSVFAPTRYPYDRAVVHNALSAAALALGGPSLGAARALSVGASLLGIVCLYFVARHFAARVAALGACAMLALSTFAGFHAVSARMYSVFQLFFLLVVLSALRLIEDPRRIGSWALLCAASFCAAGIHQLFLIAAPVVLLGLAWSLRTRLPAARLAAGLAAAAAFVVFGAVVESWAPHPDVAREDLGTWSIRMGNPLLNVGLNAFSYLGERLAPFPPLAALAVPYAFLLGSRTLGFTAAVALLAGIGTSAGAETQSPHYYLHLFPLFIALGFAALEHLLRDAWAGRDTLGDMARIPVQWLDRLRGRAGWLPSAAWLAVAAGGVLLAAGIGVDVVSGNAFRLGHDQIALLLVGATLIGAAWLSPHWARARPWLNGLFRAGILLALLLAIPAWRTWLGPYRYPPFQDEAIAFLEASIQPGDRLLATDRLIPFLRLPEVPMAFLSQRYDGTGFIPYRTEVDVVTGLHLVDTAEKLRQWLDHPGRTWILADYRLELHVSPRLREIVAHHPIVHRSDPARLAGRSPHPDWAGNTYEARIFRVEPSAGGSQAR